ncbi:DUF2336 domain-containing protein [Sneathiella chinensis]|uniref:DUF2336 domain-containing protein n=1 Tax=Sneathiella chinensis TaxID=349750 RepID=UPI0024E0DF29|nr:DUF2336 domain-containing protein [Sneathiella chinensis]
MGSQRNENINQILGLVELAEDKSPTQRKFLYQKIGDFLIEEGETFSKAEKELMADILCRITSDVEKSIRAHFSRHIAKRTDIPQDLIIFLANDDFEIALPILRDCGLLEEPDLLEIIHTRSTQHQLAIAARSNISESVSRALSDTDKEEVCVELLNNHTANIPNDILEKLGEKSETIIAYQKPLLQRPFLPNHIAEKMYRWVSVALREYIANRFQVDPRILEVDIDERRATIKSISTDMDPSEKLVEKLHKAGELSAGFMLKSLRQGEIDLFELTFAKLIDMPRNQIQKILYSKNPELLAAACRILDMDKIVFATIFDLVCTVNLKFPKGKEERDNLVTFYSLLKSEAATRALANPEFISGNIRYYQAH